ncbi:putative alcohol oxidase [Whalleya microplaca]|nr:putative alcohol oxidase [Whalleya microplaca]
MGLYNVLPSIAHEVDVIIVGGGTAGCVIASRLSDTSPELSILIIESGPNNYNVPEIVHPALYRANFSPDTKVARFIFGNEEKQLANRRPLVVTGSVLGGGSSVNGLIYARPQKDDLDSWNATGWSAEGLLPYLEKFETYHGPGNGTSHGFTGPVNVSSGTYSGKEVEKDFETALKTLGYSGTADLQDLVTNDAVSTSLRYASPRNGKRQDSAHAFLHPLLQDGCHPNLHVLVESQVIRVVFDNENQATGIQYRPNPTHQPGNGTASRSIKAKKLVVLSAGSLGSPSILERSGIGDSDILEGLGIPIIQALPGVGHDLQDHLRAQWTYKSSIPPLDTFESIVDGRRNLEQLLATNDPILSWNGIDSSSKLRPTEQEVNSLGSKFRDIWDRDFSSKNRPLAIMLVIAGILGAPTSFPTSSYFTIGSFATYPYSRGHIHITGPGIDDGVNLTTGYLGDSHGFDLKAQVWAYKKQREIARNMHFFAGEIPSQHPNFPSNSNATLVTDSNNPPKETTYTADDDAAIEQYVREHIGTAYHSLGSCKMAPLDRMGVVDEKLNVHGTKRLKVADLSIAPENISGNTNSAALMIGEKAADIIVKELGLGSSSYH